MQQLDTTYLVQRLEARFGLGFSGGTQEVDGGIFPAIRPIDLDWPNGFAIIIAKTPKIVEASLRLDSFARGFLRQLSVADDVHRSMFAQLANQAKIDGTFVNVGVNDFQLVNFSDLPFGAWEKIEIDCGRRLQTAKSSPAALNDFALEVVSTCLGLVLSLLELEEVTDSISGAEPGLPEGARIRVEVNRYERSPVNRAACIAHYGASCRVCRFDFASKYGDLGREFIEVHHLVPVSAMGGAYRVDPIKDLVPVCSNCHAMLHRRQPPLTIDALTIIISGQVAPVDSNLA